jgi:hypothetical protein
MPRLTIAIITATVLLAGCTGMRPGYETPTVTVKSVRAIGVSYTVSLEGHELIKGVGNDLPVIEGYGEGDITLNASADLFAGMGLIRELMSSHKDTLSYSFEAKLDPGALRPSIRVKDSGEVSLTGGRGAAGSTR